MKISAPPKDKKTARLRVGGVTNMRAPGRRARQSSIANAYERSVSALAEEMSDKSVTTTNHMVQQILEDKVRTLIDQRNAIIDAPTFASNLKAKGEMFEGNESEDMVGNEPEELVGNEPEELVGNEPEELVGNEPEELVAIDKKLDALERHLDGHDQLAQRFGRTKEILARLDREFAEYRRILEVEE
jgi:hypothetical protein